MAVHYKENAENQQINLLQSSCFGEPNGTEYFTTRSAIERSGYDAERLFMGLQVRKHLFYGYQERMQGYRATKDISVAFGVAKANPQFGQGGLPQIFVPDVKKLVDQGILMPIDSISLIIK